MLIEWYGHSAFKITTDNYAIFLDPFQNESVPGLPNISSKANYVNCSHEHFDHNGRGNIEVEEITPPEKLKISHVSSWHDHHQGAHRGPNSITVIENENLKLIHLGDLGEIPQELDTLLIDADVLMIPVGGKYTISAKEAYELIDLLKPRIIIPMHYRNKEDGSGFDDINDITLFQSLNSKFPYTRLNSNQLLISPKLKGIYQLCL